MKNENRKEKEAFDSTLRERERDSGYFLLVL
jgi:hypothetical protein